MADHYIVTAYRFKKHLSLEGAETERIRLQEANPKKKFKVYRITLSPCEVCGRMPADDDYIYRFNSHGGYGRRVEIVAQAERMAGA